MAKARGLGRGLSSLIPERASDESTGGTGVAVQRIRLDQIDPNPYQPRRRFREEELKELAESIRLYGVIQPIVVRPIGERYQLVAGERRVRAARLVELEAIPAVVTVLTDRQSIEVALVENLQRSDLNPLEESQAYSRLIDEFQWTQEEIGARVGKSRSHIANYLRLMQLEDRIQEMVADQSITVAHAKLLLSIDGPSRRMLLAQRCQNEGWTVKQLEAAIKRGEIPPSPRGADDVHLRSVEAGLRRRFGTKVALRGDANKGRIEISYRSLEELERLLALLEDDSDRGPEGFVV